jgi:hypothetical protein
MNVFRTARERSNRFRPQIESLEDRQLLSQVLIPHGPPRTAGASFLQGSALVSQVARTGGAAFLVGSVLHVDLSLPGANEATLKDDGHGDITVEWNGHTPPTFHGVTNIDIDSFGHRDTINYRLTGNVTKPHEVDVRLTSRNSVFTPNLTGFQSNGLTFHVQTAPAPVSPGSGGAAALVGSVLHVNLSLLLVNEATIHDDGAGNVTVEWNGHNPPTFHGVTQIVIDAHGQRNTVNYILTGNVTRAHEVDVRLAGNSTFTPKLGEFHSNGLAFKIAPALAKGP